MKRLTAFLVLALTLVAISSSAFAWGLKLDERPDAFRPGQNRGYFIWRDQKGFHLWTTTRGQRHVFTGTVTTDGDRLDVKLKDIEGRSEERPFGHLFTWNRPDRGDRVKLDQDRDTVRFRFDNSGGDVDGIDFKVVGGSKVRFDLYMDGQRIDPSEIYIGDEGWHPGRSAFTMYR